MWQPLEDLTGFNRALVLFEQVFLAVLRGSSSPDALIDSPYLQALWALTDDHPHQALLMARIKSGHAMTPRHGINVMLTTRAWARVCHKLGHRLDRLSLAALLHDLGHWRVGSLAFVFGPFSHDEARLMQQHTAPPEPSLDCLDEEARLWIRQHHEQPDGKGYPDGITDPHPLARMLRIVDCFEGLTTPRRFRRTYSWLEALELMTRWAGYKLDAGLFKSFRSFVGGIPIGTMVQLVSGEIAITLPPEESTGTAVLVLTNAEGDPLEEPEFRKIERADVKGEAPKWQDVRIPEPFKALRPDLMGLPRFYPSES